MVCGKVATGVLRPTNSTVGTEMQGNVSERQANKLPDVAPLDALAQV
jgi:hypothetical protein